MPAEPDPLFARLPAKRTPRPRYDGCWATDAGVNHWVPDFGWYLVDRDTGEPSEQTACGVLLSVNEDGGLGDDSPVDHYCRVCARAAHR